MLCDECGRRQASIHVVSMGGSEGRIEHHLCQQCAMKYRYNPEDDEPEEQVGMPTMDAFLKGIFENALDERAQAEAERQNVLSGKTVCPKCGMSFKDFQETNLVGCADCYKVFKPQLTPILRRLYGAHVHKGKVPQRSGGPLRIKAAISNLRAKLQECVASEAYEKAAQYRDEIRVLEQKLAASEGGRHDDRA